MATCWHCLIVDGEATAQATKTARRRSAVPSTEWSTISPATRLGGLFVRCVAIFCGESEEFVGGNENWCGQDVSSSVGCFYLTRHSREDALLTKATREEELRVEYESKIRDLEQELFVAKAKASGSGVLLSPLRSSCLRWLDRTVSCCCAAFGKQELFHWSNLYRRSNETKY